MKSNKCEITCMSRFNSIKVSAAVVAGLLLGAPVLLSTANVAYATVDTVAAGGEIDRANVTDYDVIHLKDKTLEKAIIDKYNDGWQTNSYPYTISEITHQVIPRIQMLYFLAGSRPKYLYIRYLDGLENFTELTTIDFPGNNISDITPLKNLNKLDTIDLSNNNISDITPLKNLNKLKKVDLSNNRIADARGIHCGDTTVLGQTVTLHPKSTTVDLKKEIIGLGGDDMVFNSGLDDNIVNGVLTYKDGMPDQYYVYAYQKHYASLLNRADYSARITVDFSEAKKESEETQAGDISEELQTLLGGYATVKGTDNYKNADDKLKQAYDEAITEGKTIYDKLSSTPEQVKQATEQIKAALDRLNGDSKSETIIEGLQSQLDTAQQKLKKAEEQGTADKAKIKELKGQISTLNSQLEQLKKDKIKSEQEKQAEINKLNGKITELGKQIEKLTKANTSLKGQIATLQATISRLTEEANQCHVSDGAKAQELEKVKKQLTQAQSDLEKLKTDKTQSDQEKQKEIDRLSNQVTQLNQEIDKLKQEAQPAPEPQSKPEPKPQVPVPQLPASKPAPEPPAPRVPDKKELPQTPKQPSVKDSRDQIHLPKTNDILVGTLGVVVVACAGVALIAYGVYKRRQQH